MFDMGNSIGKAAAIDFGIQWGCWAVAALLQTEKFYDLAGSSTYFLLAYQTLKWNDTYHLRQKVQTGMVMTWAASNESYLPHRWRCSQVGFGMSFSQLSNSEMDELFAAKIADLLIDLPIGTGSILYLAWWSWKRCEKKDARQKMVSYMALSWGIRLGLFLFARILKEGQDRRFNNVRNVPSRFFIYWTLQAVWVFITILPTLIVNSKKEDRPVTRRDYVGYGMWGVGFLLEVLADYQKSSFRGNPDNAGKFINTGLWSIVQYPNYLGEIMMWLGIYVTSTSVLRGWEHISVISPMFVTYLLTRVSGIPLQQRSAMKKHGSNPDFLEFIRKTPKLLPFIW